MKLCSPFYSLEKFGFDCLDLNLTSRLVKTVRFVDVDADASATQ